ncbi:MAG TPA: UDP-3-O-(3-hydroxymyristoyl)glucosamine N-acyltransferase [Caulobacteraceae bacterium]|jgi:UDP-3-O-[3-hydroxymyristoyl] glucosamine N-acyltransferase
MPDPRFFEDLGPASLGELAGLSGLDPPGGGGAGRPIRQAAPLAAAGPDAIAFLGDKRYAAEAEASTAGACFVTEALAGRLPSHCIALVTPEPQAAWARAASRLHRPRRMGPQAALVDASARVGEGVNVCPGAVIGPGVEVGDGCEIGPNAVVGPGVRLGEGCIVGPNAAVGFALLGARVRVGAGAVIGESGFGVAGSRGGAVDVPQLGRVMIEDEVSIGACSCIDRGAYDDTVIGAGTKIDNLVQVGHNCRLGRNVVLAGQVGLAGSVLVGDGVRMGGGVGIADHLSIGAGASLAGGAGVMHDIPAGETWAGIPARPIRRWLRESSWLGKMANTRGAASA